jgi:serine/threonine protein kinase
LAADALPFQQLGNCIGRGQFGVVWRALDIASGHFVAIKRIAIAGLKEADIEQLMHEVDLLQRLEHPGIVRYEGMSRDAEHLNIVLE